MELIRSFEIGQEGIYLDTYFLDFYIYNRTIILLAVVVVALRLRKLYKNRGK